VSQHPGLRPLPKSAIPSVNVTVDSGRSDTTKRIIVDCDDWTVLDQLKGEVVTVEVAYSTSVVAQDEHSQFYLTPTFLLNQRGILKQFSALVKSTNINLEAAFIICKL
jgi:hypothetical protein